MSHRLRFWQGGFWATVPTGLILLGLSSCGESRRTLDMLEGLRSGDTAVSLAKASELYDDGDDQLIRHMQLGLIHHLAGNLTAAEIELAAAAAEVDERRSGDTVGDVQAWMYNDTASKYPGRAFEHLQVDYYRMLDCLIQRQQRDGLWLPTTMLWAITHPPMGQGSEAEAAAVELGERAIIYARRMTIDQLAETKELQSGKRYDDDPFSRVMAACAVYALSPGERTESDQQLAMAMLTRALSIYKEQHEALAKDEPFRYETAAEPAWVRRLWWMHLRRYDPQLFGEELLSRGLKATEVAELAPGRGLVLVLHHAGLITRLEPLQIGMLAVGMRAPEPSPEERARGHTSTGFGFGQLVLYAKGPGSEVCNSWIPLPIPGDIVQGLLAPGGATVIGFELPAHRSDQAISSPATVRIAGALSRAAGALGGSMPERTEQLTVVSDLDAYARAALKDEQPRLLVRTLIRVATKQGLVAVGSKAIANRGSDEAKLLAFAFNLIGSATATASESADLRSWNTLPDHIEASLLDLPIGSHQLSLTTANGTLDLGRIQVKADRMTVVAARTMPLTIPGNTP